MSDGKVSDGKGAPLHRWARSLLLLAVFCLVVLQFLGPSPEAVRLVRELEQGPGHVVDLDGVTDRDWDRLHVFGPYTTRAAIEEELGAPWPGTFPGRITEHDDRVLVVLTHGGHVTASIEVPRSPVDLAPLVEEARGGLRREGLGLVLGEGGRARFERRDER